MEGKIDWTPALDKLLKDLLLTKPVGKISEILGIPQEDVRERVTVLNRFNPKRDFKEWIGDILELDLCAMMGWETCEDISMDKKKRNKVFSDIPLSFESSGRQYKGIFRDLIVEEVKAQLETEVKEVSTQDFGFSFYEKEMNANCHLVSFKPDEGDDDHPRFSTNDLVFFSQKDPVKSNIKNHFLGKVEECTINKRLLVMASLLGASQHLHRARRSLVENTHWYGRRVFNLTSHVRELQALSSIKDIPLHQIILDPKRGSTLTTPDLSLVPERLRSSFNRSQLEAIASAIDTSSNLSLIQGPPGTGKTRTIVAIVSSLLASRDKGRILVCAPSNAAVDEVAGRILADTYAGQPKPKLLRLGNSKTIHENSRPFSLEVLVGDCSNRNQKYTRQNQFIEDAQIVFATLNKCGAELYTCCSRSERSLFDAVVIDEAAQALEPSTLIPLQLLKSSGTTRCIILVGDHNQLPSTVISKHVRKFYQRSMFERLQKGGLPLFMLKEQYRMHPSISEFPSSRFYDNQLLDGITQSQRATRFHDNKFLGPYLLYNVDGQEEHIEDSWCNKKEVEAVVGIINFFRERYMSAFSFESIGIITPYRKQLENLQNELRSAFGAAAKAIEVNTVDGFQGREVDVLLLTTVRANPPGRKKLRLGFVADRKRMNVALTRAKNSLWIVGNIRTLKSDSDWDALVQDAEARDVIIEYQTLKQVLEEKSGNVAPGTLLGTSHSYVITGSQDKAGSKRVDLLRGQKTDRVDVSLQPEELQAMDNVLPAKYEEAREEEKQRSQREDFSDMVAENEKKRKGKMHDKDGKKKKKDFKF